MSNKTTNKFSPEVRERAVRMVLDRKGDHPSRWAATVSISEKIGCTAQTLNEWVKKAEVDAGKRAGVPTELAEKLKALERENRELRQANEILRKASAYFARPELDRPRGARGRADLQGLADCPVHLPRAPGPAARSGPAIGAGATGLAEAGIELSVGSFGDSYDNALAETINGLYKAEVIHRRGTWRSYEAVEYATLEWVDWFNNRRLLEPIGNIPPAEAEAAYYAALTPSAMAA